MSPVFRPLRRTRSLYDWFTPLDGCPRCGYAYEREDGYFLMAVWGVQYGVVALVGLGLGFGLLAATGSLVWSIVGAAVPTAAVGLLFVRYAMAFYLALDHYFDPHLPPAG
ncbi:MAG: hypothetical protein JWO31_1694 [Phycisphaerales bacterium]|nr:hypothetical protein [Phycisphaerales bacterium]